MESKDESIRLLKKRMHHQMSVSSENDIKPENIQYYMSSLAMQREDMNKKERTHMEEDIYREDMYKEENAHKDIRAGENKAETSLKESEEYETVPSDTEYIKKSPEIPPAIKHIKVPGAMDAKHGRAKNEYEKVLNAADEEEIFGFKRPHWLNIKG